MMFVAIMASPHHHFLFQMQEKGRGSRCGRKNAESLPSPHLTAPVQVRTGLMQTHNNGVMPAETVNRSCSAGNVQWRAQGKISYPQRIFFTDCHITFTRNSSIWYPFLSKKGLDFPKLCSTKLHILWNSEKNGSLVKKFGKCYILYLPFGALDMHI